MKKLFDSIVEGLQKQGYKIHGGGNLFCILSDGDQYVKVFANNYDNPSYIIVRYS